MSRTVLVGPRCSVATQVGAFFLCVIARDNEALVIDRMRQGSIVGSVRPLHGPGRQRSHASAGHRTTGEAGLLFDRTAG